MRGLGEESGGGGFAGRDRAGQADYQHRPGCEERYGMERYEGLLRELFETGRGLLVLCWMFEALVCVSGIELRSWLGPRA